jgi:hypothetical protein
MAQEVKASTIATASTIPELLENIGVARAHGWITSGSITHGKHLTQTMIKLGMYKR